MPFGRIFPPEPKNLLIAERVYLRPPVRADFSAWSGLRAESRAFLEPWEPAWGEDALEQSAYRRRVSIWQADAESDRGHIFFIFDRNTDELLGGISLGNIRRGVAQAGSLGYWLGRRHIGKGHMTDALTRLITFAFNELELHRLEAACLPENDPSQKLLLRCGFTKEGIARGLLCINGAWRDHVTFARLAGDGAFRRSISA